MTGSVLWGVLAITAFSLLGFGLLASGWLLQRLPERLRAGFAFVGLVLYAACLDYSGYQVFFRRPGGLVEKGYLSDGTARIVWAVLAVLVALAVLRRAIEVYLNNSRWSGTGASS